LLQGVRQSLGLETTAPPALGVTERPLLERPAAMPRELSAEEMHSLLRAAERDTQLVILLLLSGISPVEALELRWRDVERGGAVVHVGGACARSVRLNAVAARYLAAGSGPPDAPVLGAAAGQPATLESLSTQLLYAAHDARLERVDEITPNALRHTYIAFLVRQGVRFADLAQVVGQLPVATLAAYSGLAPAGARLARESVNLVYPGLENVQGG